MCLVEQHRGILGFDGTSVRLATDQGVLLICGEALEVETLTDTRATVTGRIMTLSIEAKS